jgi:hypothetical protein
VGALGVFVPPPSAGGVDSKRAGRVWVRLCVRACAERPGVWPGRGGVEGCVCVHSVAGGAVGGVGAPAVVGGFGL